MAMTLSPAKWTLRHLTYRDWTIRDTPQPHDATPTRLWYVIHRPSSLICGAAPNAMQAYRMARQLDKLGIQPDGKLPGDYHRMQLVELMGGLPVFVPTFGGWICMADLYNLAWWVEGEPDTVAAFA